MAILYVPKRDNRTESDHKFYGRVVTLNTINTAKLAKIMQANCTLKVTDIIAVLNELVEVMRDQLQNSNAVKLDGFGTFRVSMSSEGAEKSSEFTADNIKRLRINFLPAGKKPAGTHSVIRTFLEDAEVKKYGA